MKALNELPNNSRLWVFMLPRELESALEKQLQEQMRSFVSSWSSHGREVLGTFDLRYGRFLLVAADPAITQVSGCSIDSLFRAVKSLVEELGVELSEHGQIFFRDENGIRDVSKEEFRKLVESGEVHSETIVFNNTVQSLAEFREGKWELPFQESWHAKRFSVSVDRKEDVQSASPS